MVELVSTIIFSEVRRMDKKELAIELFKIGAIQFGEFQLKMHEKHPDAPLSPVYLNFRIPPKGKLTDEIIGEIGQILWKAARKSESLFYLVIGLPKAGDPLAKALVRASDGIIGYDQLIFLKKEETSTSRRILPEIDGEFIAGDICLVVDDLITGADTKLEGVSALRSNGLLVEDCLVLVDREQGGKEELAKYGVKLHSVFTMSKLLDIYVEERLISKEVRQKVIDYQERVKKYLEEYSSG